jgi:hypothetical protein
MCWPSHTLLNPFQYYPTPVPSLPSVVSPVRPACTDGLTLIYFFSLIIIIIGNPYKLRRSALPRHLRHAVTVATCSKIPVNVEFMVDKVALGQMFSLRTSRFLCQYHFTNAPYSLTRISLTQYDLASLNNTVIRKVPKFSAAPCSKNISVQARKVLLNQEGL